MTDIKKTSDRLITISEDAHDLYVFPSGQTERMGVEVELHLYKNAGGQVELASAAEMAGFHQDLLTNGYDAQLEAASVIEYAGPAVAITDLPKLLETTAQDIAAFETQAATHGLQRAPFSIMPDTTIADALAVMNNRERLQTGIKAVQDVGTHGALAVPLLTAGVQVSFSPRDTGQLFRMARRAYALMPLIYAAFNSDPGFSEGNETRALRHQRGYYYDGYGAAGGIADSFLKAETADDYLARHRAQVFQTPMYFAYQRDGSLLPATVDKPLSFQKLQALGLNTQANFELAESFLYHDVKICNLRDADGATIGKRLEVRAADSGLHQPVTVPLLLGALLPEGQTAQRFDRLLTTFGLTGHGPTDAPLLQEARHAAVYHNGGYMDVGYGSGRLRDLATGVVDLVASHYAGIELGVARQSGLQRLSHILRTGESDAVINARCFSDKKAVTRTLLDTKPAIAARPKPARLQRSEITCG